jgi:hypothetical protein
METGAGYRLTSSIPLNPLSRFVREPDGTCIWPALLQVGSADMLALAQVLWPEVEHWFGALREPDLLAQYVRRHLPAGRILLYGAGTHSLLMLELLRSRPDITIVAIVDRLGAQIESWNGYQVITPNAVSGLVYDYVLVGHSEAEWDMVDTLSELGISLERIRTIYAASDYRALSRQEIARRLDMLPPAGTVDCVFVSNIVDMVAGTDDLEQLFGGYQTVGLFHGRLGQIGPKVSFSVYNTGGSLEFLIAALQRIRPKSVYVSHNLHCPYVAYAVHKAIPMAHVIMESYDYIGIWMNEPLRDLFGLSARMVQRFRVLEAAAMHTATFHLSKRGGRMWNPVVEQLSGRYRYLHPRLERRQPTPFRPRPMTAILYAGWLPAASLLKDFRFGYDFIGLFQEIARRTGIKFDIYNNGHQTEREDYVYNNYMLEFSGQDISYHRRISYDHLLSECGGYDYGWLCDQKMELQPDVLVGMPNRLTGYISGGLPTVIDRRWAWCTELVKEYGAGLVVNPESPGEICAALTETARGSLRPNILALRAAMLRENESALNAAAQVLHSI